MIAFVFPGQGAQYVGMGREMAAAFPEARRVYERAGEVLGIDLLHLCSEGPEEALRRTENTQPAILTTSVACLEVLRSSGIEPDVAAGLSLGEYSALVAAGALAFEDAVRVVRRRGELMEEATRGRETSMVAILGLDAAEVERICESASSAGVVEPANFNCPGQVVIAGDSAAVRKASEEAKARGARRIIPLNVSTAFHTTLMRPAAERLARELERVAVSDARFPVVANVTSKSVQRAEEIRRLLIEQVYSPVRWEESVRQMWQLGARIFVEVGPGTSLSTLIRKTLDGVRTLHVEDPRSLEETLRALDEFR
ncbi:MAG: ACP S-malonyltransferase [Armatimonadota bacterium]|nr:ACP S-malonyltransferase [Armatimonadota bacterium]MDR5703575.1 ACP S-malonyltransferase [Armatimonadota bacterium]MDR7435153.1 ACP S-malonyltransferase [Armatimonadota bacterium]